MSIITRIGVFGAGYGVGEYDGPVYVGAKEVRVERTPNNGNYCYCVANKDGFVLYLDEKYYKIYKEGPDEDKEEPDLVLAGLYFRFFPKNFYRMPARDHALIISDRVEEPYDNFSK